MSVCSPNERVPGNTPTWWLGDCYPCHITPWLREFIAAMEDDPTSAAVLTAQVQFRAAGTRTTSMPRWRRWLRRARRAPLRSSGSTCRCREFEMLEWWGPDVEFCQDLEVRRG